MKDILFEIGVEEVPARFVQNLLDALSQGIDKIFKDKNIPFKEIKTYGTGRRLALHVQKVEEEKPAKTQEVKGPPVKIAFDASGNPTQVAIGFAKKYGMDVSKLTKKLDGGAEYLFVTISEPALKTIQILPEVLKNLVLGLELPIGMRWGEGDFTFIRPIHWMVALWDDKVIPVEIAGIKAGSKSMGHRFLSPDEVVIKDADSYVSTLKKSHVLVDQTERFNKIKAELEKEGVITSGKDGLIKEVTFLTEWPGVVLNEFDSKYLKVPQECLVATMEKNQKYFAIYQGGKMMNQFCVVGEGVTPKNKENILKGNRRVLTPRFEDARFLYGEDLKNPIESFLPKLEKVTYQEKLGSLAEKSRRTIKVAEYLCDVLKVDVQVRKESLRAVQLLKADLVSNMVRDFTELQGVMGKYYAHASGEPTSVGLAIRDHYCPRFVGDEIPTEKVSVIAGLADRMETLAGCFSAGLIPKGSGDPYALRRVAQGLVAIILKNELDFSIQDFIAEVGKLFNISDQLKKDLFRFIQDRLNNVLKNQGIRYDVIDAVLASNQKSLLASSQLAQELNELSKKDNFKILVDSAVRVVKISKDSKSQVVDESLLTVSEEKNLYQIYQSKIKELELSLNSQKYSEFSNVYVQLLPAITAFFEKVLVMDKDEKVKANRLALVKNLDQMFKKVADFEKIAI